MGGYLIKLARFCLTKRAEKSAKIFSMSSLPLDHLSHSTLPAGLSAPEAPLAKRFFAPLLDALAACPAHRQCPDLPDRDWLVLGTLRAVHAVPSGRAFLQEIAVGLPNCPEVAQFFETLKSERRLALCEEAGRFLATFAAKTLPDRLANLPLLAEFDLYAGDGHVHAAAAHDPRSPKGSKDPTGHLFALDLRQHRLFHLSVSDQQNRRKEHDMRALKRLEIDTLRLGARTGRKVLYVWDRAGIDFPQWHRWKHSSGIYFLSREKDNMALEVIGENAWDKADALNAGTLADELCAPSNGVLVRRVRWMEPVSGEEFAFLTNELTLPPGLIAELYRRRWNIEKVFDLLKSKLGAKKAWATSANAKTMQAQFLCIAHNLLLLLETIVAAAGVSTPPAELRRRRQRLERQRKTAVAAGRKLPSLWEGCQRLTQLPFKFIRWLRSNLWEKAPWLDLIAALARSYAAP